MKEFFDTSVLVATFHRGHVHHEASIRAVMSANNSKSACALHTLAEVYAVMTALPVRPPVQPEQALLFVEEIQNRFTPIGLDLNDYKETIEAVAGRAYRSGRIYDALLLRCAMKWKSDVIYTWNLKHFQDIFPDLSSKIKTPDHHI